MSLEQEGQPQQDRAAPTSAAGDGLGADVLEALHGGEMSPRQVLTTGSNYTFITSVSFKNKTYRVIYKPRDGEAPLWDFPEGTLYKREYAAYLLSEALGWHLVPPTVIRSGQYGVGAVQLLIAAERGSNYFTLRQQHLHEFRRLATFDLVANNADRKAGHCIRAAGGRIWSIDHGLTFHSRPKLRTVIWDFAQEPIPQELLADLQALAHLLATCDSGLVASMSEVLAREEMGALAGRVQGLLAHPQFPTPRTYRDLPWPWV